jgi:predicted Na+-dependent transporter
MSGPYEYAVCLGSGFLDGSRKPNHAAISSPGTNLRPYMAGQPVNRRAVAQRIMLAMAFLIMLSIAVPLILGAMLGVDAGVILGFIGATFALQAASPPLGLALGLSPAFILVIMAFFALGIVVAIREACDALSLVSSRVRAWIARLEQKTKKHPFIKRYGAVSCILIAWIPGIGLYGTPVISWLLRWKRVPSLLFTTLGFVIAAGFVLAFANRIQDIDHLLLFAGNAGVVIFAVTTMLSMGFSSSIPRVLLPLKNTRVFVLAVVANLIVVPLVAWLLATGSGLSSGMAAGLVLVGVSAGATFLPGLARVAKADPAVAEGTAVLLTSVSIVYIPLVLPFLLTGVAASAPDIFLALVLLLAVPLAVALFVRSRKEELATRMAGTLSKISFIALIVAFVSFFLSYYQEIPAIFVTGGILAIILFIMATFVIGFLAGVGEVPRMRRASGLGTSQRNLAAALVVAAISFSDPGLLVTALLTGLAGLLILAGLGKYMATQAGSGIHVDDSGSNQ